jgi:signal peptidase II
MKTILFKKTGLYWLWVALLVIFLDQGSKLWVMNQLSLYEVIPINLFFSLTFTTNKGAAFSFLSQSGPIAFWVLTIFAVAITVFLTIWISRNSREQVLLNIAICLIIGGAIGNLIDRLAHGYVIDFLLFRIVYWYFPAFNLADTAISIGAFLIIIDLFRQKT